jgi:hypothetical protein
MQDRVIIYHGFMLKEEPCRRELRKQHHCPKEAAGIGSKLTGTMFGNAVQRLTAISAGHAFRALFPRYYHSTFNDNPAMVYINIRSATSHRSSVCATSVGPSPNT